MSDSRLNHNQSRRDCRGMPGRVAQSIGAIPVTALPPSTDNNISPAAQACNATKQGWANGAWFAGCPDSWRTDGYRDYDCQIAYGAETAAGSTVTLPTQYTSTSYNYYYCPDSWRGDGMCDLCIVAKYGYDAKEGSSTGADDCAKKPAGTTSWCSDLGQDSYGYWDNYAYQVTN
jgi:hypothetical protein